MPNPMNSLQTLLRLKSPSQVQTGDPWLARRQSEIASGMDEILPEADSPEYKFQQIEDARRTGIALPRADYRSGDMSKLRQVLGMKQREHEQNLEQEAVKGAYGIEANRAGQDAAMQRILATQGSINERSGADREARSAALEQRLGSMESNQAARDAAAMERAQFNQGAMTQRAEAKKPRSWIDVIRGLLGGGAQETQAVPSAPPAAGGGEFDFAPATGRLIPRR